MIDPSLALLDCTDSKEAPVFWGEIAPCEHIAQFYEREGAFLDALAGFVGEGINAGESTIIIATPEHRKALRVRLVNADVDLYHAMAEDRFITLDAETALARFMINELPDEELFTEFVGELIRRASIKGRRVRAFGEMVALLWARGEAAATVRLEYLWDRFCHSHSFSMFCAYPKAGFTKDKLQSLADICDAHSRIV
jgi:KaiC/GvpD/RAD55 family RecA-like ATPase